MGISGAAIATVFGQTVAAVLGVVVLSESMNLLNVLGIILVLVSIYVMNRRKK